MARCLPAGIRQPNDEGPYRLQRCQPARTWCRIRCHLSATQSEGTYRGISCRERQSLSRKHFPEQFGTERTASRKARFVSAAMCVIASTFSEWRERSEGTNSRPIEPCRTAEVLASKTGVAVPQIDKRVSPTTKRLVESCATSLFISVT